MTTPTHIYVRSAGGVLWHVRKRVTENGLVDMLCGMMATGRAGPYKSEGEPTRRFDERTDKWPEPRCLSCRSKVTGEPPERWRPTVRVDFPDLIPPGHETVVIVTVRGHVALTFAIKAATNMIKVFGPIPASEELPGIGRISRYLVRR